MSETLNTCHQNISWKRGGWLERDEQKNSLKKLGKKKYFLTFPLLLPI